MKHEYLLELDGRTLDTYAKMYDIDVSEAPTKAKKVELIEKRLAHVAHIDVLGLTVSIPIRRLNDTRVTSLVSRLGMPGMTNEQCDELLVLLVGKEQHDRIIERCTDEDGIIDQNAFALAITEIVTSDQLKNS